jgi:hypothetical protein
MLRIFFFFAYWLTLCHPRSIVMQGEGHPPLRCICCCFFFAFLAHRLSAAQHCDAGRGPSAFAAAHAAVSVFAFSAHPLSAAQHCDAGRGPSAFAVHMLLYLFLFLGSPVVTRAAL